uniref:Uncharacterized protein n=1 Tax=Cucumis sativus TaxID=3659 RepID=A0A0A0L1B0_CUCSA
MFSFRLPKHPSIPHCSISVFQPSHHFRSNTSTDSLNPHGNTLILFSNLLHPRQQQSIHFLVNQFLCFFNLHSSVFQIICYKILSFALQFCAIPPSFKIEANIANMDDLIIGEQGFQETPPPPRTTGVPEFAIERLMTQKFDGFNKEERRRNWRLQCLL